MALVRLDDLFAEVRGNKPARLHLRARFSQHLFPPQSVDPLACLVYKHTHTGVVRDVYLVVRVVGDLQQLLVLRLYLG